MLLQSALGRGEEYVVCICGLALILRTPHLIRLHHNEKKFLASDLSHLVEAGDLSVLSR